MSLSLLCPSCGKKYRAPDHLAGHKVKCRGCGTVFALTESSETASDIAVTAAAASSTAPTGVAAKTVTATNAASAKVHASATSATRSSAISSTTPVSNDAPDDADAIFQSAFSGAPATTLGRPARRANVPIPYPGSRQIDHWLPIVLPAVSLLWVGIEAFVSNGTGAAWAPLVRLLALLVGFFVVIFPIGWASMNIAAAQGRFHLPPNPKLRTIAAFALPTAIAAFLYLSLGSLSSAIPGAILGVAVAMGATWLLLRAKPEEAAATVIAGGGGFAVAILICTGLLLATNSAVHHLAGSSGTQLAESPLGPGLPWQKPAEKKDKNKKDKPEAPASPDATSQAASAVAAATQQVASATPTEDPFAPSPAAPAPAEPTKPAAPAAPINVSPPTDSQPARATAKKEENMFQGLIFGPATPKPPKPEMPQEEDPDPAALPAAPASTPPPGPAAVPADYAASGGDQIAFALLAAKSPVISSVRKTTAIGTFEQLVTPLTPSNIALIHKTGDRADIDILEAWDLTVPKKTGTAAIKRDVTTPIANPNGFPSYACSADGSLYARITTFPSLSLEVTAFAGGSPPIRLPLKDASGDVSVVGFATNDRVLIRWRLGQEERLEVWDIKARSRAKILSTPSHPASGANGVLSPDGKLFAVVGSDSEKESHARLSLIDISGPGPAKVTFVNGIDAQRGLHPTGMAFSSDGKRLGVLYEQGGNTILMTYRVPGLIPQEPMAAPAGRVTAGVDESVGGRLTSVANGRGWLLGGNAILDAENGKLWGELGLSAEQVCTHSPFATAAGEIMIVAGDPGQRRVTLVAVKAPADPATRPK